MGSMLYSRIGSAVLLLTSLHGLGTVVLAQTGTISGTVVKAMGGGFIEGARIELVGTRFLAVTTRRGEFSFKDLEPGKYTIQASAIGYSKLTADLELKAKETLEVEFQAQSESVRLPDVDVKGESHLPSDFLRRSQEGGGRYLTRAEIERRPGAATVSDLLRTFPGVRIVCRTNPCIPSFTRATRNCGPSFFLDGMETEASALMMQPAREVDGIEVYSGLAEMPAELRGRNGGCGAFVVWTRTPSSPSRPKKP